MDPVRSRSFRARSSAAGVSVLEPVALDGTFDLQLREGVYEFSVTDDERLWHLGTASVTHGDSLEFSRSTDAILRGRVTTNVAYGIEDALVGVTANLAALMSPGTIFEMGAGFVAAARTRHDGTY